MVSVLAARTLHLANNAEHCQTGKACVAAAG